MKMPDENVRNDIFSKIVPSDCLVFMFKWLIRMYQGNPLIVRETFKNVLADFAR